jgi:WD40 repeat protein
VLALVVDEPSSRLYSSSADATVRAWDLTDMSCVAVIRGHSKPVTKLQLLGGRLLFTAAGGAVRVWDTRTFACLAKVRTSYYSGAIRSLLVSSGRLVKGELLLGSGMFDVCEGVGTCLCVCVAHIVRPAVLAG